MLHTLLIIRDQAGAVVNTSIELDGRHGFCYPSRQLGALVLEAHVGGFGRSEPLRFDLARGQTVDLGTIVIVRGGVLHGRVVFAGARQEPVPYVQVTAFEVNGPAKGFGVCAERTDAEGRFLLSGIPGEVMLRVSRYHQLKETSGVRAFANSERHVLTMSGVLLNSTYRLFGLDAEGRSYEGQYRTTAESGYDALALRSGGMLFGDVLVRATRPGMPSEAKLKVVDCRQGGERCLYAKETSGVDGRQHWMLLRGLPVGEAELTVALAGARGSAAAPGAQRIMVLPGRTVELDLEVLSSR